MASELVLRFVLGGVIVSIFAVVGDSWKPKTFSGIFGAAPSVALASLALAYGNKGASYVATEAHSMIFDAVGLFVYGAACVDLAKKRQIPVTLAALAAWGVWFASTFALWGALNSTGAAP